MYFYECHQHSLKPAALLYENMKYLDVFKYCKLITISLTPAPGDFD